MAGKELGFLKPRPPSWKEPIARLKLEDVRKKGHTYVELREDGKSFVFFCTLCLAPCHSETILSDHLNGYHHNKRLTAAKKSLMGTNPWPFNDGFHFFRSSDEEEKDVGSQGTVNTGLLEECGFGDDRALVVHSGGLENSGDGHVNGNGNGNGNSRKDCHVRDEDVLNGVEPFDLVIPGVLGGEEISELRVRLMGYGQISARVLQEREVDVGIRRLWCEWLGKRAGDDDEIHSRISSHDFAIVTFRYCYDLGKQSVFDEIKTLLLSSEEDGKIFYGSTKRRKKSLADSEDAIGTLNRQCDSSAEDSQGSSSTTSSPLLLNRYDDQLLRSRIISDKGLRREVRRLQSAAADKMCDICQQKMLPGKDVAALLNLKTGRLACSSRNVHGAFHVFHTSCLIHWILLCESEMFMKPPVRPKVRRRSRRKTNSRFSQLGKECDAKVNDVKHSQPRKAGEAGTFCDQMCSVFCPDCQGTGVEVEENELEKPTISLSKLFAYKIKVSDAHRSWMKDPEELGNCSTGFAFPITADDVEEKVVHMKLLHFYRAGKDCWPQSS